MVSTIERSLRSLCVRALAALPLVVLCYAPNAHALDEKALAAYHQAFAQEVCKDGGGWLRCFQLDPSECSTVLGKMIERCTRSVMESRTAPAKSEQEVAAASKKIVRCVEQDFRQKYDAFKLKSEECSRF
jgi:hypothetical protein